MSSDSEIFELDEIQASLNAILIACHLRGSIPTVPNQGDTNAKEYSKPKFNPRFWRKHEKNYKEINAIIEMRAMWKYVIQEASYNYSQTYSKLTIPISHELKVSLQKHKEEFGVYDRLLRKWLVKTDEPKYKYCFDGDNFLEFKDAKRGATSNRLLLVGKYTILKQEPNLLRETELAPKLFDIFEIPKKTLTVGVPGCGKTTYIIKNHSRGSLVLTSCAEGAKDIRARMADLKGGEPFNYKDSYRTIDSYLMNSREEFSHVWIDEALMEHPGKLFLVCVFSRCRSLTLLGDPNQLGYINRLNAITLRYDKSAKFFETTEMLRISYRCPVDVITTIASKYDGGAYSASKVLRSMKCKTFRSLKDVPKSENIKYLVFKQAEKKKMAKAGYDVSTIHEYQGKEAAHVILVRMSHNLQEPLYKSAAHILVGMSRHRESLIYYTPVTDNLKILIQAPRTIRELRQIQVPTHPVRSPWYNSFTNDLLDTTPAVGQHLQF